MLTQTPKHPHSSAGRQRGRGYVTHPNLRAICHLAEVARHCWRVCVA